MPLNTGYQLGNNLYKACQYETGWKSSMLETVPVHGVFPSKPSRELRKNFVAKPFAIDEHGHIRRCRIKIAPKCGGVRSWLTLHLRGRIKYQFDNASENKCRYETARRNILLNTKWSIEKRDAVERERERHGCQMAIARFLDRSCLALRASGLWLRLDYGSATLRCKI